MAATSMSFTITLLHYHVDEYGSGVRMTKQLFQVQMPLNIFNQFIESILSVYSLPILVAGLVTKWTGYTDIQANDGSEFYNVPQLSTKTQVNSTYRTIFR